MKSNLQQLDQTIGKLQQYEQEYQEIREVHMKQRNRILECRRRIKHEGGSLDEAREELAMLRKSKSFKSFKEDLTNVDSKQNERDKMGEKEAELL